MRRAPSDPPAGGALRDVRGDASRPSGDAPAIIAHVCNDAGRWGAGFVLALRARWPAAERQFRAWAAGQLPGAPPFALGRVQVVPVAPGRWVANMIAQHGIRPRARGAAADDAARGAAPAPIRYEALAEALGRVAQAARARGAGVHMPRIGTGLAGGRWDEVEPLVQRALVARGVAVTVYDLPTAPRARSAAGRE